MSSDSEPSQANRYNESAYTHSDVIAAAHLFTSANDAPLNDVTLGFPLTYAGATFAFREQVTTRRDNFNPFSASCSKLLLFEGSCA